MLFSTQINQRIFNCFKRLLLVGKEILLMIYSILALSHVTTHVSQYGDVKTFRNCCRVSHLMLLYR